MGQQVLARRRARIILTTSESDVMADGERLRLQGLVQFSGLAVRVYTHPTEVVLEARLHEGTSARVERLTGRAQYFVNAGRRCGLSKVA